MDENNQRHPEAPRAERQIGDHGHRIGPEYEDQEQGGRDLERDRDRAYTNGVLRRKISDRKEARELEGV